MKAFVFCGFLLIGQCYAGEVSDETKSAVSGFIDNMVHGKSKLFFEDGIIREGKVITGYEIVGLAEQGSKIQLKVRYSVVGTFSANEAAPMKPQVSPYSEKEKQTELYEFVKQGKSYRLNKNFERMPYILNCKLGNINGKCNVNEAVPD